MSDKPSSDTEKFLLYNSLAILLKAVEGERTTVDLRNEASIYGTIEQADGWMNIVMRDCIFTDPRGGRFPYEMFFIHARNIRYVHVPAKIPIIPAIKSGLCHLSGGTREQSTSTKRTFRSKRTQQTQLEGRAAVERLLKEKESASDVTAPDGKEIADSSEPCS